MIKQKTEVLIITPGTVSDRLGLDLDIHYTIDKKYISSYQTYIDAIEKYEFRYASYTSTTKNKMLDYVNEIIHDWPNISYAVYMTPDTLEEMFYHHNTLGTLLSGNVGIQEFINELYKYGIPAMPLKMTFEFEELSIRDNYKDSIELITSIPKVLYLDGRLLLPTEMIWLMENEAELTKYLAGNPNKMHNMTPREYERLVASVFTTYGFEVELTPQTRDGGFDILAIRNDKLIGEERILIECKRYSKENKVGLGVVQRLVGAVNQYGANKGIIATTSTFTKDAINTAISTSNKVSLKDFQDISDWIKDINYHIQNKLIMRK
ncbi:MAG: restriction endonuclease [Sulfurimonas sp.]|jgi:HJR/Mrr/RecB family endonuclease